MSDQSPRPIVSAIPLLVLIALLVFVIAVFGSDSLNGGSQVALLLSMAVCVTISMTVYRMSWKLFERQIMKTIGDVSITLVILLTVGMLSGSWMVSGIVPTLIYYGVQIISPQFFLFTSCIICALVSVLSGSSWTTIATIGVAFIGIGHALGISEAWTAGAIISGAYFGDKMSPLSDTTILASSAAGVDLFRHIRYMVYTTVPSFTIALVIYFIAGLGIASGEALHVGQYTEGLANTYHISLWTLLGEGLVALFKGLAITYYGATNVETGDAALNELVSTGGMAGMLNTIWLIISAMCFGAVMVASGMIQSITRVIISYVKSLFGLVANTVFTGLFFNLSTGDQFISIVLTADMYRETYKRMGYQKRLLSRTTEDAVTVTSVLVPWNTCGMTQSTVLGVATLTYLPYCFFNLLSPLMACFVAALGWKIKKVKPEE